MNELMPIDKTVWNAYFDQFANQTKILLSEIMFLALYPVPGSMSYLQLNNLQKCMWLDKQQQQQQL